MHLTWYCPKCLRGNGFELSAAPEVAACSGCGERQAVAPTEAMRGRNVVDRCAFCGCGHLYLEKDFNGYVGMIIVVAAIIGSGILWARNVFAAVGVLGAAALVDLVFWMLCKERTVCYKCVARYRRTAANPDHGRYELGTAGRFADDYDEQRGRRQT
jgi:hypothetical protein